MIINAKSLSGEYVSIDIDNYDRIHDEFEKKYKERYVSPKLRPFISVKLINALKDDVENEDDKEKKEDNEDKIEWYFLVDKHKLSVCLETYKESWMSLCLNPHPMMIEMLEDAEKNGGISPYVYKYMSRNLVSVDFFIRNPDKIYWRDMLSYNERSCEVIHLYKKCKLYKNAQIIKYSSDAYQLIKTYPSIKINWEHFLKNKHVQPEWVQYVIDEKPEFYGEELYTDENGRTKSAGDYSYTFKLDESHWKMFSKMPVMIPLLQKYKDKICWKELCENPCSEAIDMLRVHRDKVIISSLCNNHSKDAISFLQEIKPDLNINKKGWSLLCRNPYAIDVIKQFPHSIKYLELAKNTNDNAIELIKTHLSIPTLSVHYRNRILRKLIENNSAGPLILDMFERGEFNNLGYEYTDIIMKQPYIFCDE